MTHWVLARQMPDGRWLGNGLNRPPLEYSIISHTAIAAGGLAAYPLPGRQQDIDREPAAGPAMAARGGTEISRGTRHAADGSCVDQRATSRRVTAAIKAIRDQQEAGGGWSQFSRTDPDAYATGLSLYALHVAGVPPSDEAYRKGVAFLLGSSIRTALAREDALVPGAAIFRKRISVRAASVDLSGRHELGGTRDRADAARYEAITITNVERRDRGDRRDQLCLMQEISACSACSVL